MSRRATRRLMAAGAALVLVAALAAGLLLTRTSSSEASSARSGETEAESAPTLTAEARDDRWFPAYYLGESFEGLPLEAREPGGRTHPVVFIYGSCEPSGDSGCAPPLQVQTWPACKRNPSSYELTPGVPMPRREDTVRGVPAAFFEGGLRLELSTGSVTVVIFGEHDQIVRAAEALRGFDSSPAPGEDLPPPVTGAVDGKLACS